MRLLIANHCLELDHKTFPRKKEEQKIEDAEHVLRLGLPDSGRVVFVLG